MIGERTSYKIYIQHIDAITLQLQDTKQDIKKAMNYIKKLKDLAPGTNIPSLQELTLTELFKNHIQDLIETREKINRTINIVLCQVPHLDMRTDEYTVHSRHTEEGGKNIFDTSVTLTLIKSCCPKSGSRVLINASDRLPSTKSTFEDLP